MNGYHLWVKKQEQTNFYGGESASAVSSSHRNIQMKFLIEFISYSLVQFFFIHAPLCSGEAVRLRPTQPRSNGGADLPLTYKDTQSAFVNRKTENFSKNWEALS